MIITNNTQCLDADHLQVKSNQYQRKIITFNDFFYNTIVLQVYIHSVVYLKKYTGEHSWQ